MSKKPDSREMGLTYEVAQLYTKDWSMTRIKKEKSMHQEEVRRRIRKALKWFLVNYEGSSDVNGKKL